jgi:hypothetical protein
VKSLTRRECRVLAGLLFFFGGMLFTWSRDLETQALRDHAGVPAWEDEAFAASMVLSKLALFGGLLLSVPGAALWGYSWWLPRERLVVQPDPVSGGTSPADRGYGYSGRGLRWGLLAGAVAGAGYGLVVHQMSWPAALGGAVLGAIIGLLVGTLIGFVAGDIAKHAAAIRNRPG